MKIHNFFNTHFKELLSISIFKTFQHCLPHFTLKKRNKRLDCAISFATVMSSSEGLPYVQHNNKNDLEASGSHSNVDSNKDENESSSNSNTKIENASILDTVRLLSLFLYISLFLTTSTKLKSILIQKKNLIYLNI